MGRQCRPNSLLLLIETSVELQTGRRTVLDPDLLQATGDPGQGLAAVFRPVRAVLFILDDIPAEQIVSCRERSTTRAAERCVSSWVR